MALADARVGSGYIVHALDGLGGLRLHLERLGVVPGTPIQVIARMGGNLIVDVRGSRVALDEELAKCVLV